ncbi:hypothetical protein G6699_06285 [Polynucleobacter paneuropaeus]|jgi:hypothetical protein|nr:hypothetical protein [Polynucleobacter paneuropaeus]
MNIVLTKEELDGLGIRKANRRLKDAWVEFIGDLGGEWAVTVHLTRHFSERQKTPDFEAYAKKICRCLKNAINREFHGRRSKTKILFIPVIEGLKEFKTTHFHFILGNLGTNNKQRVTKKLAYVFSKNRMIDVALKKTTRDRVRPRKACRPKPKNRIRQEALVTGVLVDPLINANSNKGMKVERIYSKGWAAYILKEQTGNLLTLVVEEIQKP